MEVIKIVIYSSLLTTVFLSLIILIIRTWIKERIKLEIQKIHSEFVEELKWESKTREKAEKVAEYLSFVRNLEENSDKNDYIKANRMSWELAMWLPEEIYKEVVRAIINPNADTNELSVVISVRQLLLGDQSGNLNQNDVAHHAPGIGKKQS